MFTVGISLAGNAASQPAGRGFADAGNAGSSMAENRITIFAGLHEPVVKRPPIIKGGDDAEK